MVASELDTPELLECVRQALRKKGNPASHRVSWVRIPVVEHSAGPVVVGVVSSLQLTRPGRWPWCHANLPEPRISAFAPEAPGCRVRVVAGAAIPCAALSVQFCRDLCPLSDLIHQPDEPGEFPLTSLGSVARTWDKRGPARAGPRVPSAPPLADIHSVASRPPGSFSFHRWLVKGEMPLAAKGKIVPKLGMDSSMAPREVPCGFQTDDVSNRNWRVLVGRWRTCIILWQIPRRHPSDHALYRTRPTSSALKDLQIARALKVGTHPSVDTGALCALSGGEFPASGPGTQGSLPG